MVFEAIWNTRHEMKWTDTELIDAYDYVNNEIVKPYNDLGKNFAKVKNEHIEQLKINKRFNIK